MKLFGYEPAAWAGALQGLLGVLVVFGVGSLTADQSTLIQAASAALFAVVTAFFTKKVNLVVVVSALQAMAALLVGFGLTGLTDTTTAAVIAAIQVGLAGFLRQNTEPAVDPGFNSEPLSSEPLEPEVEHAPVPAAIPVFEESVDGMPSEQAYV